MIYIFRYYIYIGFPLPGQPYWVKFISKIEGEDRSSWPLWHPFLSRPLMGQPRSHDQFPGLSLVPPITTWFILQSPKNGDIDDSDSAYNCRERAWKGESPTPPFFPTFLVLVLLSEHTKRFVVSCMPDFYFVIACIIH